MEIPILRALIQLMHAMEELLPCSIVSIGLRAAHGMDAIDFLSALTVLKDHFHIHDLWIIHLWTLFTFPFKCAILRTTTSYKLWCICEILLYNEVSLSSSMCHWWVLSQVYAEGPARHTGGAAAVAMLIGPNAPIAFESKLRGSQWLMPMIFTSLILPVNIQ